MVLSHRAKFQLIINFFRVKAISIGLELLYSLNKADITTFVIQLYSIFSKTQ